MKRIDDKKFITAWMESTTYDEAAERLHVSKATMNSKSCLLRKRGVNLPLLTKTKKSPSYTASELNELVRSYGKPTISQRHKNSLFNRKKIKV